MASIEEQINGIEDDEVVVMSETFLKGLMREAGKAAADACIKVVEAERLKKEKNDADNRLQVTKEMLKNYRREKLLLGDEESFTDEEKAEKRWEFLEDLIGKPLSDDKLTSSIPEYEHKRKERRYSIWLVDNAIRLYETEAYNYGTEVDIRRFRVLRSMYIDEERMQASELAEEYGVSEKAIYKDLGIATKIVMVYLFGTP